jgi:hypothetical protein
MPKAFSTKWLRDIYPIRRKIVDIRVATVKVAPCSIACQFQDMVNPQVNLVQ